LSDLVVFCSSEEKRVWKQRHEGMGFEKSTALRFIIALKAEPHECQEHETRFQTGKAEVKPREVEKTCGGDLTADWTPQSMLSTFPERCRGRNFRRVFFESSDSKRPFSGQTLKQSLSL